MGLITEIDLTKLEPIAEKHGLSVKQVFEIWSDVHHISQQVLTENIPMEKLKLIQDDLNTFIMAYDALKKTYDDSNCDLNLQQLNQNKHE